MKNIDSFFCLTAMSSNINLQVKSVKNEEN